MKKKIIIICISIVCIYALFITEESIRFKKDSYALPLIVLNKIDKCIDCVSLGEEVEVEYKSIGFKTKLKYTLSPQSHDDLRFVSVIGKEFYLFNKILLWGWII